MIVGRVDRIIKNQMDNFILLEENIGRSECIIRSTYLGSASKNVKRCALKRRHVQSFLSRAIQQESCQRAN